MNSLIQWEGRLLDEYMHLVGVFVKGACYRDYSDDQHCVNVSNHC